MIEFILGLVIGIIMCLILICLDSIVNGKRL